MTGNEHDRRPTRFVILFEGRTGSTYLIDRLDSSPFIDARGEVLDEYVVYRNSLDERARALGLRPAPSGPLVLAASQDAPMRQLERAMDLWMPRAGRSRAVGFKTKLRSLLEPDRFAQLLRALDVRVIHMTRRNVVKQVISSMNAARLYRATGEWNLYRREDALPRFRVDLAEFQAALDVRVHAESTLSSYVRTLGEPTERGARGARVLHIDYEDILENETAVHERVQAHLGVPALTLRGSVLKNTGDDLRQVVENFDELRSAYRGSPYAPWFDEVVHPRRPLPANPPPTRAAFSVNTLR